MQWRVEARALFEHVDGACAKRKITFATAKMPAAGRAVTQEWRFKRGAGQGCGEFRTVIARNDDPLPVPILACSQYQAIARPVTLQNLEHYGHRFLGHTQNIDGASRLNQPLRDAASCAHGRTVAFRTVARLPGVW